MDRRRFLFGGACCAAHGILQSTVARAQSAAAPNTIFFCTAIDRQARTEAVGKPQSASGVGDKVGEPIKAGDTGLVLTPYGTAFKENTWEFTDGLTPGSGKITLGVFLIDPTTDQRERTIAGAQRWLANGLEKKIAFRFDVPREKSQIRVTYEPKLGNFSEVGKIALRKTFKQRTMNLGDAFSPVIEHEFGHALGLEHEHQFPGALRWKPEHVIADMQQYWSVKTIQQQITDRMPDRAACVGDPEFNRKSVMLYPIRPNWAEINENGTWKPFVSDGGNDIHSRDYACLRGLYGV